MKTVNIVTLGCSKNLVDSECIAGQLAGSGYRVVFDRPVHQTDIAVINTCGFIGDAKQESIDTILEYAYAKRDGLIEGLYVMGCLSERYKDILKNEIPEADEFFGVRDITQIVQRLASGSWNEDLTTRLISTPKHYAYLKISEGCSRSCAFCAIPLIRGPHISVPMERLVMEAAQLAAAGVRELIVIAQDTTWYGLDLYGDRMLGSLLRKLCKVEGIRWIRLQYAYPYSFPEDVIEAIAGEEKICKYIDIPLQHITDSQLRSMHRAGTRAQTEAIIDRLREKVPGITIRTTMMVGYPGETQGDFDQLLEYVGKTRFDRLGAFSYSQEEGTSSARRLRDDVPPEVKQQRLDALMNLQMRVSAELNRQKIGLVLEVVIDSREGDYYVCRSQADSPEVDQEILVSTVAVDKAIADGRLLRSDFEPGNFVEVAITAAEEFDLYAVPCPINNKTD